MTRKNFNCPACSAPMEYDGESTLFQNCGSCGAPIVVPAEIVQAGRDRRIEAVVNMPPPEQNPTGEVAAIRQLVNEGRKIEAIKLHRETFGSDLAEAKKAVENIHSGQSGYAVKDFPTDLPEDPKDSNAQLGIIKNELKTGNKINAIKLFREIYNTGLREAKDAVDALERDLGKS